MFQIDSKFETKETNSDLTSFWNFIDLLNVYRYKVCDVGIKRIKILHLFKAK